MKRRIVILTIVLTFLIGIGYGQNNFLTVFNNVTNNEDSENDVKVEVVIEGVRSKKGKLVIAIFKDQESFEKKTL